MQTVPLERICYSIDRLRAVDQESVDRLVDSIRDVGLLHPIVVRPGKVPWKGITVDGYLVVCGGHRLEACRQLGWTEIPVIVTALDRLQYQLAEVDENLCGTKLTPAERALFTRRRKEIYVQIHPETKQGGAPGLPGGGKAKSDNLSSFAEDTAERIGVDRRTVEREAARGERIDEQALADLKGTSLDKGVELDAMARLPADAQRDLAARAKAGEEVSAREAAPAARGDSLSVPRDPVKAAEALCKVFTVDELAMVIAVLMKARQNDEG